MDCSVAGLPVPHHHPRFAQVHIYFIGDAIQPSHSLSPSSPFVLNLSQHQALFQPSPKYSNMHYFLEVKHSSTMCQREVTHGHMPLHPSEVPRLGIWRKSINDEKRVHEWWLQRDQSSYFCPPFTLLTQWTFENPMLSNAYFSQSLRLCLCLISLFSYYRLIFLLIIFFDV